MIIRPATKEDIPAIVNLLKTSLGESLMPKSVAYWNWKHIENPFGESPVWVALEADVIIGVRAFMRWDWDSTTGEVNAIRAVDTATHPDHQGKGIFKKLTLQLLDISLAAGYRLVFNTPNTQSRPGYLKMGWKDAGRLPIRIAIVNPLVALLAPSPVVEDFETWYRRVDQSSISGILQKKSSQVKTKRSWAYLQWRYGSVPNARYSVVDNSRDGQIEVIIFRIKKTQFVNELRMVEVITSRPEMTTTMYKLMTRVAWQARALLMTSSGMDTYFRKGFVVHRGPIVTIRDNGSGESIRYFDKFMNWHPTLGDLELF